MSSPSSVHWLSLVGSVWLQTINGPNADFPVYSSQLKEMKGISQVQLNFLAFASDTGKLWGWFTGVAALHLPLWLVAVVGAAFGLVGYGVQFLFLEQAVLRYYSTYGHVARLAEEMKKGADFVDGVEVTIWRVPETLPEEVLAKMHAAPAREDHPVARQLADADGVLFGFPTRFGMMASQMKAFFDSTGGLWQAQSLAGKPAGVFFATGTQGGGQETTALTAVTQLTHHGMLFVPVGYTFGAGMFAMDEVKGGSPYGAGTFAGADGSRMPSETELGMAEHQGKYFAGIAKKLKAV